MQDSLIEILNFIQLAISTFALVANALHDWLRKIFAPSAQEPIETKRHFNGYADLAMGWGCCAIFVLTAGHSMIIAGAEPTVSYYPILALSFGALVVGFIITFSWKANRLERSLWSLALASIFIMLLGQGGPLSPIMDVQIETTVEPALPYWIAIPILIIIFASFFIAEFPRVIDFKQKKSKGLLLIICFGLFVVCLGSGKSLVQSTLVQRTTPAQLDDETYVLAQDINAKLKPEYIQRFYRIASEIELNDFYRTNFYATLQELEKRRKREERLRSLNRWYYGIDWSYEMKSNTGYSQFDYLSTTNNLLLGTRVMSAEERIEFLVKRMEWRHPISVDFSRSSIGLPGLDSEERHRELDETVLKYAQINLARTYGLRPVRSSGYYYGPIENTREDKEEEKQFLRNMNGVFPRITNFHSSNMLISQLSLPLVFESGITFLLYQQVALENSGKISIANEQYDFDSNALPVLYELANSRERIEVLFKLIDCQELSSLIPDLELMSDSKTPDLVSTGLFEIYDSKIDKNNSRLVDFFVKNIKIVPKPSEDEDNSDKPSEQPAVVDKDEAFKRAELFRDRFLECGITRGDLSTLLKSGGQAGLAIQLLSPELISFIESLGTGSGSNEDKFDRVQKHLMILSSPISVVWSDEHYLKDDSKLSEEDPKEFKLLSHYIERFKDIENKETRQKLLHHLAVKLYGGGTPDAPSVLGYVISQARMSEGFGASFSTILASTFVFPFVALSLLIGLWGGRLLLNRSAIIAQAEDVANRRGVRAGRPPESPTQFQGRSNILVNLRAYAKRGWNTVALIGPRGVGKSEILKELVNENIPQNSDEDFIGVWLQAPTKFDEVPIVRGVQSRVAQILENRISNHIGANSMAERELREDAHNLAIRLVLGVAILIYVLTQVAESTILRLDSSVIWMPVGLTLIVTISMWIAASIVLQRKDLGFWLRRSPKNNPHLELLYERCLVVLFGYDTTTYRRIYWLRLTQFVALAFIVMILFNWLVEIFTSHTTIGSYFIYPVDFYKHGSNDSQTLNSHIIVLLSTATIFFGSFLLSRELSKKQEEDQSWTTSIEDYRSFIRFCIERLNAGAFGQSKSNWRLIVAIDELDRITDASDLRKAIIRMRSMFEIRSVYYYLSLASDSYNAFMDKSERTKTEMDSAFDHIEHVPPLPFESNEKIIINYLKSRDFIVDPSLINAINLMSFGIPRDTIRKCDSLLAIAERIREARVGIDDLEKILEIKPISHFTLADGTISFEGIKERDDFLQILDSLAILASRNFDHLTNSIRQSVTDLGYAVHKHEISDDELKESIQKLYDQLSQLSASSDS